jgi:hypothetical protein
MRRISKPAQHLSEQYLREHPFEALERVGDDQDLSGWVKLRLFVKGDYVLLPDEPFKVSSRGAM